jgi:tetratricopeptide (TPR) repeat protein
MLLFAACLALAPLARADDAVAGISDLAHAWAKATYATPDDRKAAAYEDVLARARELAKANPSRAEPLVWEAIVLASAAKAEGGFGALRKVKESRDLLLAAQAIDANAMDGSIYASLGSLYAKVPGWPIGFGDKKKAREYLQKALAIDQEGIDANYFYGDFLADQGEYADAVGYLKRALAAPARPGREDADAGRRQEAQALLTTLRQKHGDVLASR